MKEERELWAAVLDSISKKISKPSFDTWLKNTKGFREGNKWIITTNNEFARDWLQERYHLTIQETIKSIIDETPIISFNVDSTERDITYPDRVENIWLKIKSLDFHEQKRLFKLLQSNLEEVTFSIDKGEALTINPNYIFENFEVSSGNRFAVSAAKAVAEAPGKAYNPLFMYGPTGVGKTHLLHAIGNYVLDNSREAKIIYQNSDQFMNDFINSIRENNREIFRERFRHSDVFLFDDVDFLIGKESTQEELFHIFNILHEQSKQIVFTSTCSSKEISLDEKLRSRFEWGLVTEISKVELLEDLDPFDTTHEDDPSQREGELKSLERIERLELEVKEMKSLIQKLNARIVLLKP